MSINQNRFQILDMARGTAIMLMVGFHFCYDLVYFNLIELNIREDFLWTSLRNFIVSLFIFIAGISLYISSTRKTDFFAYLKKQKWLALFALLISLITYPLFPESWIYFGVLHFILAARIFGFALKDFYGINIVLGIIIIWAGITLDNEIFNPKWINWLGFAPQKPFTEDYVPLFPWFGVFLLGMCAGRLIFDPSAGLRIKNRTYSGFPAETLSFAGRHSLSIYMVHQPVLMGLITVFTLLF